MPTLKAVLHRDFGRFGTATAPTVWPATTIVPTMQSISGKPLWARDSIILDTGTMLEQLGLFGLFLGCALSATIIPFSSEALLAGALLLNDRLWLVVFVAAAGNKLGGMFSFMLGWLCKWDWLEKYLKVNRQKLDRMHSAVSRYGYLAALFAWLPVVGDLIAIAMGLLRLRPLPTAVLMFIGKLARYIVVAGIVNLF